MYQRILNGLEDFFGISRKEARGALMLMLFCGIVIWTPFVFRQWLLPMLPPGSPPPERRVLDSIALLLEKQQALDFHKGRRPAVGSNAAISATRPIRPVYFDPNTASEQMLTGLGIPAFFAKRIVKFRKKGGSFRRKEDLLKIYDFPPDLYRRLEKYIVIATDGLQSARAKPAFGKVQSESSFDINQCDTTALIRLRGIGSKLAMRILKFRDALGGFHSVNQFQEIYGLDSLALSELRHHAKVLTPVKKIPVNTATADELGRHPYLRNKKALTVLINYRNEHGPFRSLDDLRLAKALDEAEIQKAGPYLSF